MEQSVQNPMGTAPVGKLMRSMGLPIILSMMIQALYNIVDSVFVSNMTGAGPPSSCRSAVSSSSSSRWPGVWPGWSPPTCPTPGWSG